eukprot:Gb_02199 [translate_table: standard]
MVQVEPEKPQSSRHHAPGHQAVKSSKKQEEVKFLTWPEFIPNGFIQLDYEDSWNMFKDVLLKDKCKMENHELWRPTFTANIINILISMDMQSKLCKLGAYVIKAGVERKYENETELQLKLIVEELEMYTRY